MTCPHCGNQVASTTRFCGKCGGEIPIAPPAEVIPVAVAAPPNHQADGLIGSTLEGKYRIEAKLGAGGMGAVYRATRLLIGDEVAIKVLHAEQVADPQAIERFRREAQAAARLKHPNAVSIYDFGVSGEGLVYLVMELVEGQSLRDLIKQQGPLTPTAAAEVMSQVCAALDEAHRQHIVHRDMKPDNIIVNATGAGLRVKVLDFGIAKMRDLAATAGNLTQAGNVMGTPHYMSPEQCLGEELDNRSDIYSLGAVLYEMLVGVVPFNSPTSTAVVVQHVNQSPPSLRAINVSISQAVEAVVLRALEKRREARPPTAGALAQELTTAVSGAYAAHAPDQSRANHIASSGTYAGAFPNATPGAGLPQTVTLRTPASGNIPQIAGAPFISGASAVTPPAKRNLVPILIGAALVLALGGGAAWWALGGKSKTGRAGAAKAETNASAPAEMAYVPGGAFTMGNNAGELAEAPAHQVSVKPFYIDLHEVTCEDYQKFLLATNRRAPQGWEGYRHPAGAARRPVTGVNWDDAAAYAAWAGKRLPTEAEWEFAARGADGRRYPWGNEWKQGFANADSSSVGHMTDAGAYASGASPYGALDMVGNAWEWTASDFIAYP
ncbi:MAG: SUMF1/EgtB/PvdO family nonheme iron enzyme, partial [Acidobacteriota bacterium]